MRVVITGIGMINAVGNNKEEAFENIINAKTGIDTITHFDATNFASRIAGEVKNFDPKTVMDPKDVKKADRFIHLGMAAAKEAMADSGLSEYDKDRFGISAASGIGGLPNIQKNSIVCETRGPRRISPFFIPSALVNMLGGFVSIEYGLKGPNLSSVTACAAGTHAITEAFKTIKMGMADKMMVVAGEAAICEVGVGGFAAMKALSTRNDEPQKASRPFDAERDGFVMGEGAGILVLEELEHAKKRGAKIYAEIVGYGLTGDAYHITAPCADADGAKRVISMALNDAKLNPEDVDYVNAHGTSTPLNDKVETLALKKVFKDHAYKLKVSSNKSMIGHLLGAAGAVEAVATALTIKNGIIPPTINYENPDPDCDLDYVPNKAIEYPVKVAISNSFGFGGTNACLAFKAYEG